MIDATAAEKRGRHDAAVGARRVEVTADTVDSAPGSCQKEPIQNSRSITTPKKSQP
jgi:hypothetical protein